MIEYMALSLGELNNRPLSFTGAIPDGPLRGGT